ncbi:hypothetical protein ACNJRW_23075, partial [Stenotrophomonas maltophilia]
MADATEYQLESGGGGQRLYTDPSTYVNDSGGTYCAHEYRMRACSAVLDGFKTAYSPFSYGDIKTFSTSNSTNYVSDPSGVYKMNS